MTRTEFTDYMAGRLGAVMDAKNAEARDIVKKGKDDKDPQFSKHKKVWDDEKNTAILAPDIGIISAMYARPLPTAAAAATAFADYLEATGGGKDWDVEHTRLALVLDGEPDTLFGHWQPLGPLCLLLRAMEGHGKKIILYER